MTNGEVWNVDSDPKKITIKHGEIKNLAEPNTTMAFRVVDRAGPDEVTVVAMVRFTAAGAQGAITVWNLEAAG